MNELDSLLQVFKEIDNNLKNSMIKNRINLYNKDFDYEKLVKIIKEYIENFNILRETSEDNLVNEIKKKATNILSSTKEEYFNVHSFTNDAIFLIEKVPHANTNKKIFEKSPMLISVEIENKFYLYLLERNYQPEYILRNVRTRVGEQIRAEYDFVIQDMEKNIIAYIEVKVAQNKQILSNVVKQVRQKLYHDKNIPFYLVVYLSDTQKFIYILLDGEKEINLNEFPSCDELINNSPYRPLINHTNWNNFVNSIDFKKLANIQKNKKDLNYEEGEKVRVFLNQYAISLQEKVPELKAYKWKLNQASTQIQWTNDNGFRLSFYKGESLPASTQINITFWASWYGGIFIKDNENLIFSRPEIIDDLKKEYPNVEFIKDEQHVMAIHFKNGMPKENEVIVAIQQLLAILENIKLLNSNKSIESEVSTENGKNIAIPLQIAIKKKSEMRSVLGVEAVANTLSSVIVKEFDDSGMMIGIFGKWGRGKTHFSHRLWDSIKEKKSNYIRVSFSAWKYQDTKASWAYLYENIFTAYLDDLRNENTYIKKLKKWGSSNAWHKLVDNVDNFYIEKKKIFKINLQKHSWFPIVIFSSSFLIAFIWSFSIDKPAFINYIVSTFGILVVIKFLFFFFQQKPSAVNLYKKYFFKNHFSGYLGLQSEIENELIILLKAWIPNANDDKKIVLFVDDIDRCKIEQVIDIVDGLRVILDNPEIHNRLIIITAIDEEILKQALEHKYIDIKNEESIKISFMYKEYLEKIFIIGLKLNTLSDSEAEEILLTILPDNLDQEASKNNNNVYTRENNESINQSNNELQKDNLGNTNENITEVISDEATMETNELENHDAEVGEINIHEKKYLLDAIKRLDNITPRKIRIFYYKYLIMKILFDIRIKEKNLILDWNKDKNEKITIDLLIHLANDKKASDFRCSIKKEILKELAYVAEMVSVL